MQLSTTPTTEGFTITEYCGVVTGEAILGANIFRDFFAGVRDIVGGRSGAYEKELRKARLIAFEELEDQAKELGANAVVGIDIDYETVGKDGSMLMVTVSGTAVSQPLTPFSRPGRSAGATFSFTPPCAARRSGGVPAVSPAPALAMLYRLNGRLTYLRRRGRMRHDALLQHRRRAYYRWMQRCGRFVHHRLSDARRNLNRWPHGRLMHRRDGLHRMRLYRRGMPAIGCCAWGVAGAVCVNVGMLIGCCTWGALTDVAGAARRYRLVHGYRLLYEAAPAGYAQSSAGSSAHGPQARRAAARRWRVGWLARRWRGGGRIVIVHRAGAAAIHIVDVVILVDVGDAIHHGGGMRHVGRIAVDRLASIPAHIPVVPTAIVLIEQ